MQAEFFLRDVMYCKKKHARYLVLVKNEEIRCDKDSGDSTNDNRSCLGNLNNTINIGFIPDGFNNYSVVH